MLLASISDQALVIIVAVATMLGAGVGGVIAGLVTLRAEKWREKRERLREEQTRDRNLKEAARLVDEELRDATDLIRNAVYQGRWWAPPRKLSTDVYSRYRSVLAVSLDDAEWTDVSLAFQELNGINWGRLRMASPAAIGGVGDSMNTIERADLLSVGLAVIQARQALAPLAAPPDKDSLRRDRADEIAAAVFPVPDEFDEELRPLLEGEDEGQ